MNILARLLFVTFLIQSNPLDKEDVVVSLERTMCQGMCPAYEVSMGGDGQVRYLGHANVKRKGEHFGTIDPRLVQRLAAEAKRIDFFSLKSCEGNVDAARSYVAVTLHGEKKSVSSVSEGSRACPDQKKVSLFADKIDQALKSVKWR